jgi:hypothetical protein
VLVLSNTLARAAARYYPRRFGVRLAEWRVIDRCTRVPASAQPDQPVLLTTRPGGALGRSA